MPITCQAFPFDTVDTTEAQYGKLFQLLQEDGLAGNTSSGFGLVTPGSGMTVNVAAIDSAYLAGVFAVLPAPGTVTLDAASAQTRIDRVVLRVNSADNTAVVDVLKGTPGAAEPLLTQAPGGVYEIPLAGITVPVGAANIVAGNIADERTFISRRVRQFTSTTRPTPTAGRIGFNLTTLKLETADGTTWRELGSAPPSAGSLWESFESGWAQVYGGTTGRADAYKQDRLASLEFQVFRSGSAIPGVSNGNITNVKVGTLKPAFRPIQQIYPLTPSAGGPVRTGYVQSDGSVFIAALLPDQDVLSGAEVTFGATFLTSS